MGFGLQGGFANIHKRVIENPHLKNAGNVIVIGASIIAAVKFARAEKMSVNSPLGQDSINDSIKLAHRIWMRTRELFPTLFP